MSFQWARMMGQLAMNSRAANGARSKKAATQRQKMNAMIGMSTSTSLPTTPVLPRIRASSVSTT